jgi:hypothetical protein
MHWSTAADQPKSYESCLTVVTLIEGCPRKRNSAKQALKVSADVVRELRAYAAASGLTMGEIVAQSVIVFLADRSKHG